MFVGHYAVAFGIKAARPETRLWPLMVAVQAIDIIWAGLVIAGVEHVRITPGHMPGSNLELQDIAWSHSLATALVWSLLLGGAWLLASGRRREAVLVGLAVISHWLLDLVVHEPDLALWPGGPEVGFGLWQNLGLSLALELGLVAVAGAAWVGVAKPPLRPALAMLGLLMLVQGLNYLPGMEPTSPAGLAGSALAVYLVVTSLAAWIERPAARASA
jgi:hypothetical protein